MTEHTVADHYLSDPTYECLLDVLTGLDRDPAHPQPLRDRIVECLGEVGSVWPQSIDPERRAA
jgi:hypothetical protein